MAGRRGFGNFLAVIFKKCIADGFYFADEFCVVFVCCVAFGEGKGDGEIGGVAGQHVEGAGGEQHAFVAGKIVCI